MSKRVDHPIILGIVGDSASGKSTLSVGVAQILGEAHCTVICTDDYHRYDRKARAAAGLSALDPRANYVDVLEQHLRLLRAGEPILKPVYDHRHGTFEPPEYVRPKEFVIAEGLLGYTTRTMRDCYDVKIYLDPRGGAPGEVEDAPRHDQARLHAGGGQGPAGTARHRQSRTSSIRSAPSPISSSGFSGRPTPTAPIPGSMSAISCARRCPIPTSPRCSTGRAMPGCTSSWPATATASRRRA